MRRLKLCQHTKDNGELCGSPALRRKSCCYYHDELRRRERRRADALLFRETHARCARELIRIKTLMTNLFGNNILEGTYCPNVLDPRFYNRQRGGGYAAERRSGSATAAKGPEREMPR
jgi:hypothetical protein